MIAVYTTEFDTHPESISVYCHIFQKMTDISQFLTPSARKITETQYLNAVFTELYIAHWHSFQLNVFILMPGLLGETTLGIFWLQVLGVRKGKLP